LVVPTSNSKMIMDHADVRRTIGPRFEFTYNKGGLRIFAASAKSKGQREESGRSECQPDFSVV
jgi:hypothetical protein